MISYELADGVATLTMDDGKVNALSTTMFDALHEALDRAQNDEAVVVITGRATTFSAGFDLKSDDWRTMVAAGARTAERLLGYPAPVVAACNGNALAMAAFMLLSCDVRIGVEGPFKIGLNEVAIGLTVPHFGLAIARHRLTRPAFDRCTVTGAILTPEEAQRAGFLDELVAPERLADTARATAQQLTQIDRTAHANTKLRTRAEAIAGVREGLGRLTGSGFEW